MNAFWMTPLGPIGLLLGGGGVLLFSQRYLSWRMRQVLPVGLTLASMAAWLLLRLQPQGLGQWWVWQAPLELKTALGVQWDGWVWLVGWLMFVVALSALLLPSWRERPGFTPPAFWTPLLLAASLLVITAATWSTLLGAWALLIFFTAILAASPSSNAPRVWSILLLSVLFLLAAPLFNGFESLLVVLSSETLNLQAQLLLLWAVIIPLGVYPFHFWFMSEESRPRGVQMVLQLTPALAALYLLGRFELPLLTSLGWIALAVAGLLGSAIAAWLAGDSAQRWMYVVINRATWAALSLSLFRDDSMARMLLPLTSLVLAVLIWTLTLALRRQYGRWMKWMALFFLLGFPFTTGFTLNLSLSQLATSLIGFPVWLLVLAAQALLVAAVLRPMHDTESDSQTESDYLPAGMLAWMLALVVLFGVLWGFFPATLARSAGLSLSAPYHSVFLQIRSAGLLTGWMTVLAPVLLGGALARWHLRLFYGMERWQKRLMFVVDLRWLERLLLSVLHYLSISLGFAADILDGAGQFGWVLLTLLLLWLFMR